MIYWHAETLHTTALATYESLLTAEEALVLARLPHAGRRAEWLLGRAVAKQLVQRYLLDQEGVAPDPRAISILPNAAGAPYVEINGVRMEVALSISHSNESAFCALVGEKGMRIGVDIESIMPRDEQFQRDFLSADERALVASAAAEARPTLITAIWCGREAYFKALGTGLPLLNASAITCLPAIDATHDWSPMAIQGAAAGEWEASWRVWGGFVLAIVTG